MSLNIKLPNAVIDAFHGEYDEAKSGTTALGIIAALEAMVECGMAKKSSFHISEATGWEATESWSGYYNSLIIRLDAGESDG